MKKFGERKGLIIFLVILVIVFVCAIFAYYASGPQGIEERFSHALGIQQNNTTEEPEEGLFGFTVEGSPLLYIIVLSGLAIACFILYRYAK